MIYSNIFYFRVINKIGGTETFLYEIAKKYYKYDITIFYSQADEKQLERLKKYVRCKKYIKGEKVTCKRAFFNFNTEMVDDVISTENYYAFISHANYQELGYAPPIKNEKLNHFIGVSEFSKEMLNNYGEMLGRKLNSIRCYNPLTLEPKEKVIQLITACRLEDRVKGGTRLKELVNELDNYSIKNNRHYILYVFSNQLTYRFESNNVVIMKPRTDIRPYIQMCDYLLQLSNDMETYCYSINEALGYGVPIVTTPLTILNELPITDNEHIVLDYDLGNIKQVVKDIFEKEVKPFTYNIPKDTWDKLLVKNKSTYQKELKELVEVTCIQPYNDIQLEKFITKGSKLLVTKDRKKVLVSSGVCE